MYPDLYREPGYNGWIMWQPNVFIGIEKNLPTQLETHMNQFNLR